MGILLIDVEIDPGQQMRLMGIQGNPIYKIEALIHPPRVCSFGCAKVTNAAGTGAILNFVFGDIHINQIGVLGHQGCACSIINDHLRFCIVWFWRQRTYIEKVGESSRKAFAKEGIVTAQKGLDQRLDLLHATKRLCHRKPIRLHSMTFQSLIQVRLKLIP